METNENEQEYQTGSNDFLNQLADSQLQHKQANNQDGVATEDEDLKLDEDEDEDDDESDEDYDDDEMDDEETTGTGSEMSEEDESNRPGTYTAS